MCLSCFNGSCAAHSLHHYQAFRHPLTLNIKRFQQESDVPGACDKLSDTEHRPLKITKLQIIPTQDVKYTYQYTLRCIPCGMELDSTLENLQKVKEATINSMSAKQQAELKSWQEDELQSCEHASNIPTDHVEKIEGTNAAHCADCQLNANLWLCI